MSQSTVLKFNYSDSFVLTTALIYEYMPPLHSSHTKQSLVLGSLALRMYFSEPKALNFYLLPITDQQWFIFSPLISTHKILSMSQSTELKFNYSDSFVLTTAFIYEYMPPLYSNHTKQSLILGSLASRMYFSEPKALNFYLLPIKDQQ